MEEIKKISRSVKYNNDLNLAKFEGWSALDMNILFGIMSLIKEKGLQTIDFDLSEIKELVEYKRRSLKDWKNQIRSTTVKIMGLTYYKENKDDEETTSDWEIMSLFSKFEVISKDSILRVTLSENWVYILNDLKKNFTSYDLGEFLLIKTFESKNLYRYLKQWKFIGEKFFKIEEFKTILDLSNATQNKTINSRVIPRIKKELSLYFENLKIEAVYSRKHGNPITGYKFTWKPEERVEYDPDKYKKEEPKEEAKPVTKTKTKSNGLPQYSDDAFVQRRYFNGLNIIALDETFERDKIGNIIYFGFDTSGNYISVTESDYNEPLITVLTDKVQIPKSAKVIIDELREKEELENQKWEKTLSDFFEHL